MANTLNWDYGNCSLCHQYVNHAAHTCYPYQVQPHPEELEFIDMVDQFYYDTGDETKTIYATRPEEAAERFVKWLDDEFYGGNDLSNHDSVVEVIVTDQEGKRHFYSVEAYMEPTFRSLEKTPTVEEQERLDGIRDEALAIWRQEALGVPSC